MCYGRYDLVIFTAWDHNITIGRHYYLHSMGLMECDNYTSHTLSLCNLFLLYLCPHKVMLSILDNSISNTVCM